jgi:hypothetical protein
LTPQQINHARKMIDAVERREDVAALFNVNWTMLYHALSSRPADEPAAPVT